jgi:hypothetical protein
VFGLWLALSAGAIGFERMSAESETVDPTLPASYQEHEGAPDDVLRRELHDDPHVPDCQILDFKKNGVTTIDEGAIVVLDSTDTSTIDYKAEDLSGNLNSYLVTLQRGFDPEADIRGLAGVAIAAYRVSDDDGGRPCAITADGVRQWVDEANLVFAAAGIRFTYDGVLHELHDTEVNNLTGEGDPFWDAAKNRFNTLAARQRRVLVVHRFGPGVSSIGGGFS